ncbi:MAG: topoisomerase IV, partial [Oscillospiraceae bacterium]|nr:topoisomerase IV [Oscillospiraceae bacterium]
ERILLDIDKAIAIIRNTPKESMVVPNLMDGFGIDEIQAEYVAEIKLRNINREYILKRIDEISRLRDEIDDLEATLKSRRRLAGIIKRELADIIKKHGQPRRTQLVGAEDIGEFEDDGLVDDYPVRLFLSREGYFKKITPQSLRMSGEQKYKEDDGPLCSFEGSNRTELLFFTDRQQVYKTRAYDFPDTKASSLGSFLPSVLNMDEGETVLAMVKPGDYKGSLLFVYENGKAALVELNSYATKTNRRRLTGAYSDKSPLVAVLPVEGELNVAVCSSDTRTAVFSTSLLSPKPTRSTQGVQVLALKKNQHVVSAELLENTQIKNLSRYRIKSLPGPGALLKGEDSGQQQESLFKEE